MLKIFIKEDIENVININDVYFNKYTFGKLDYATSKSIIKEIDGVELTQDFKIISKFTNGILDLTKLSTGCKTLLNVIYLIEYNKYPQVKAINCTECGWNALEQIFELLDETNAFGIIIEHDNELYNCSDRDYLVNDKEHITSMFDFN